MFDLDKFEQKLKINLDLIGLNINNLILDHIAYRADSNEHAEEVKTELLTKSKIISEEIIADRPIFILELLEPITILGQKVFHIKLAYPKLSNNYQRGWEHIELVIPPYESDYKKLIKNIEGQYPELTLQDNPNFELKINKGDQVEGQQPNPIITLSFENQANIKFHSVHIKNILNNE